MKTNNKRAQGSLEYMMMIAIALTIIIGAAVLINQLMSSMKLKSEADADLNKMLASNDVSKAAKILGHMKTYYTIRKDSTVNFGTIEFGSDVADFVEPLKSVTLKDMSCITIKDKNNLAKADPAPQGYLGDQKLVPDCQTTANIKMKCSGPTAAQCDVTLTGIL